MRKAIIIKIVYMNVILGVLCCSAMAQVASLGPQFLKMGTGSRALAMGDAFCGIADDSSAVYWNPAGLAYMKHTGISLQHMVYLFDINHSHIIYGKKYRRSGLGVQMDYLYSADEIRDANGDATGSFSSYNSRLICGYGIKTSETFSVGLAAETIRCSLYQDETANIAINLGMLYKQRNLSIGVAMQNIEHRLLFFEEDGPLGVEFNAEAMPEIFRMGVGYQIDMNSLLGVDYCKSTDNNGYTNVGFERILGKMFAVRMGYKFDTRNNDLGAIDGFTMGFGVSNESYDTDIVVAPRGDLGVVFAATISYKLP